MSIDELGLMKAAAQGAHAPPPKSPPAGDIVAETLKQREEFVRASATDVDGAQPVQSSAPAVITYRCPDTGVAETTTVTLRVLLTTDERMLVWQVAYGILRMPWENAPANAREEAYAEAVCRVQWDSAQTVPAWFKRAYTNDPEFAVGLATEVDALTEAYFRGSGRAGGMAPQKRFVVKREGSYAQAGASINK